MAAEQPNRRADDPRLGESVVFWQGDVSALWPGRAVLVGFPQDEGVRRNQGRAGAATAPREIRRCLYRLTPWDGQTDTALTKQPLLDAGNLRIKGNLEETQNELAQVIGGILASGAIPIVLGGGHETAYGHFLGYVAAERRVGIINLDAHLDVRPCTAQGGHSGSPFRQAMEHPAQPLPGAHYACLGAQPQSVSKAHHDYVRDGGATVIWSEQVRGKLAESFVQERDRLARAGCQVYVSIDADVARVADVPGVSAPNPAGLSGREIMACARVAGESSSVSSVDVVEVNPLLDRDGQSSSWASLVVWNFLVGLANRAKPGK